MFEIGCHYSFRHVDGEGSSYQTDKVIEVALPLLKVEGVEGIKIINVHSVHFVSAMEVDAAALEAASAEWEALNVKAT